MAREIKLHESWLNLLDDEFNQDYMQDLREFLAAEKARGKIIFPEGGLIFNALNSTPFNNVKVVVLGQDPYHGPGQAHGLSFSVPEGVRTPPSLINIYKELNRDLGMAIPGHGCLQKWADLGVLLLNATLTVEQSSAGSHQGKGWERFTDKIVALLNEHCDGLVFLLWGSYAQKKGALIDANKHCVLKSPHPSPLSAHRGFLGNGHFSQTNLWLSNHSSKAIDWNVD